MLIVRGNVRGSLAAVAAVCVLASASPSRAQCDDWRAGFLRPTVMPDNHVFCATTWDPDGAGPLPPRLVVGGYFTSIGGVPANRIASWDGTSWQTFGTGLSNDAPNDTYVSALTTWDPDGLGPLTPQIIAGGAFKHAGGVAVNDIARWDGSAWQPLGAGLDYTVHSLTTWDPDGGGPLTPRLVAGGLFGGSGGAHNLNHIAFWNGATWQPFGVGVEDGYSVFSLTSWDHDGSPATPSFLVAGGRFTSIGGVVTPSLAAWNGSAWTALGTGVSATDASVHALTSWDPDGSGPLPPLLIAGGSFQIPNQPSTLNLASWDGANWLKLGTQQSPPIVGVLTTWDPDGSGPLKADLIAAGVYQGFTNLNSRWNGASWTAFGPNYTYAAALTPWDADGNAATPDLVAVGGLFGPAANDQTFDVKTYDGASWSPCVSVPTAYAAANFGGKMVVGGKFGSTVSDYDNDEPSANLAAWNGTEVSGFLGGTNGTVRALKSYSVTTSDYLLVGGDFTTAGGASASRIALWRSSPVVGQTGWYPMGAGLNGSVRAVERFNSETYAAGFFTASFVTSMDHIARWDGSFWRAVGNSVFDDGLDQVCYALKVYNGALYAGGAFSTAPNNMGLPISTGGLARWNGTAWSSVGGVFSGTVYALEVHNGELYIGGSHSAVAGSPNLVKYNGTTISAVGTGAGGPVYSLLSENGNLFAGGDFTTIGGVPAQRIAKWDGAVWTEARGGADGAVRGLAGFHNEVQAVGEFVNVRGGAIRSPGAARFLETGAPWIVYQPASIAQATCNSTQFFEVTIADGYTGFTGVWRRNDVLLNNGSSGTGSFLSGATTNHLTISGVHPGDVGQYECTISSPCGGAVATIATLGICRADFNCSGTVTVSDIFAFLSAWFAQSGQTGPGHTADFDGNNTVNVADIFAFLSAWFAGCS